MAEAEDLDGIPKAEAAEADAEDLAEMEVAAAEVEMASALEEACVALGYGANAANPRCSSASPPPSAFQGHC